MSSFARALAVGRDGRRLSDADVFALLEYGNDLPAIMKVAVDLRDRGHGAAVSSSRKVFIPLTQLCRDSCGMEEVIASCGRRPRQRTTIYGEVAADRIAASFGAAPLRPPAPMPIAQRERGRQ